MGAVTTTRWLPGSSGTARPGSTLASCTTSGGATSDAGATRPDASTEEDDSHDYRDRDWWTPSPVDGGSRQSIRCTNGSCSCAAGPKTGVACVGSVSGTPTSCDRVCAY